MNLLQKRLVELSPEDVRWLREAEVQEGPDVEFKERLATKDGNPDRWVTHGDRIGDIAKDDLTKELVGFANADGGVLVLGIEESADKPHRAAGVCPIPNVVELGDRLKMACRDRVEPRLRNLEVRGIPMNDDGSGVVVLRVSGGSPFAPHRHRANRECYIRRNDETLPMDMTEIQRQSVELGHRLSRIDDVFVERRATFAEPWQKVAAPKFGLHACALPLSPLLIPNVHRLAAARPVLTRMSVQFPQGNTTEAAVPIHSFLDWRPIVRGTKAQASGEDEHVAIELKNDGAFSLEWVHRRNDAPTGHPRPNVYVGWMVALFCNVLLGIERIRRAALAPSAEFAIEVTYMATKAFGLADYAEPRYLASNQIEAGQQVFPRYPVGPTEQFTNLVRLFETDVLNLAGRDHPEEEASVDFSAGLTAIDQAFASG